MFGAYHFFGYRFGRK